MQREEVMRVGSERTLVGIASLPANAAQSSSGVLLLNAGLVHRVGPSRLWVQMARRLCELGLPVLRLDFSGVGDSPQSSLALRFEQSAPLEARAGIDSLQAATGAARFTLIGLCSGAEIAFKTALVDPRVNALVLINAPRFLEEPSADLIARLEKRQAERYYWRVALRNPRSWWKAVSGRADLGAMFRALVARIVRRSPRTAVAAKSADAGAFQSLLERGVMIHLVLSEGDWAQDYLDAILDPHALRSKGPGSIESLVLPGCDHLLTPLAAQQDVLARVERWASDWSRS